MSRKSAASVPEAVAPFPRQGIWVAALMAATVALRVALAFGSKRYLQSDEALVGIMALDFMRGAPIPAFPYGNDYAGGHVLEALAMVPLFKLFGPSDAFVTLIPALASCLYVGVVYLFVAAYVEPRMGLVAATLFSFSSTFLTFSFYANGSVETSLLAWLGLFFFFRHWLSEKGSPASAAAAGFCFGAAYWCFDFALFHLAAALGLWFARARFDAKKWGVAGAAFAAALPLGAAPLVIHNLTHGMANFRNLFARTAAPPGAGNGAPHGFLDKAVALFIHDLPAFFTNDIYDFIRVIPPAAWIAYALFVGALVVFIHENRRGLNELAKAPFAPKAWTPNRQIVPASLAAMLGLYALIYCLSGSGGLAPRYLLPMYPFISIALAWGFLSLLRRRRAIAFAALALYGATQLWFIGQLAADSTTVEWNIVTHGEDIAKLAKFMEEKKLTTFIAPYEIKMKLIFESQERLTGGAEFFGYDRDPGHKMHREVIDRINRQGVPFAIILDREMRMAKIALNFRPSVPFVPETELANLRREGVTYETSHVGRDYVVFHNFSRRFKLADPLAGALP